MKITELIAQLEALKTIHGDLDVQTMLERGGELDFVNVTGVSVDDFDGEETRVAIIDFAG